VALVLGAVLEVAGRLFKTEKPKGWLWWGRDLFDGLSKAFAKVAGYLDKVLPQRLKPPQ